MFNQTLSFNILIRVILIITRVYNLEALTKRLTMNLISRISFYRTRSPLQDKYNVNNIEYTLNLFYTYHTVYKTIVILTAVVIICTSSGNVFPLLVHSSTVVNSRLSVVTDLYSQQDLSKHICLHISSQPH